MRSILVLNRKGSSSSKTEYIIKAKLSLRWVEGQRNLYWRPRLKSSSGGQLSIVVTDLFFWGGGYSFLRFDPAVSCGSAALSHCHLECLLFWICAVWSIHHAITQEHCDRRWIELHTQHSYITSQWHYNNLFSYSEEWQNKTKSNESTNQISLEQSDTRRDSGHAASVAQLQPSSLSQLKVNSWLFHKRLIIH